MTYKMCVCLEKRKRDKVSANERERFRARE